MAFGRSSGPRQNPGRILVTGASRGLGLELVRQYAHAGARVFAGCREPEAAGTLRALAEEEALDIERLALDVTDRGAIDAAVERIGADGDGRLDVLVNNAGVSPRGEELSNLDADAMLGVLHVNAVAPMIVAQRCRALLAAAARPRVVNLSSAMGSLAKKEYGRHYSYAASKAALNMLTRAAAHDLRDEGIVVVALHPGWVQTDLGGGEATLSPRESVAGMVRLIEGLSSEHSSRFLTWTGDEHPW